MFCIVVCAELPLIFPFACHLFTPLFQHIFYKPAFNALQASLFIFLKTFFQVFSFNLLHIYSTPWPFSNSLLILYLISSLECFRNGDFSLDGKHNFPSTRKLFFEKVFSTERNLSFAVYCFSRMTEMHKSFILFMYLSELTSLFIR